MEDRQPFPSSFGELLKTARKRQRMTQQQLAHRLGVHANTISSWELGSYLPAARGVVLELARHLALDELATRHLLEASLIAFAPYWSVPLPRNPFFTGREEILEALHARLHTDQVVALTQSYALHGLGGIGKTQIALEYAYRYALEYSAVFWIEAETVTRITASLLRLAACLQLSERQEADQPGMLAAIQLWLATHHHWLLIWDNLEDPELLRHWLPPARKGAILITTRSPALGPLALGMDLLPMGNEEGGLFLLRRARVLEPGAPAEQMHQLAVRMPKEYAAPEELVKTLGGLPLDLDQAGAYIEETGCGLADYFQRYTHRRAHLLDRRGTLGGYHPHSVMMTFKLSHERVEREQKAAANLLRVCAFLQAEAIPEELFTVGAAHLGSELESMAADPVQFDQAIAVLRRLSLVQRQAETHTISLHRLVQTVLLESMTETERAHWTSRVIAALDVAFPEVLPATEPAAWEPCKRLLPHAMEYVHQVRVAEESCAFASLAYKAAQYLRESGRYREAEPLFQRALQIQERVLGVHHPDVARTLHYLALLYWNQGKYEQAEPLFQRALSIREQVLGPDHPFVAFTLFGLAHLYLKQGKYEQAEVLYQRVLRIQEQSLDPDHSFVAFTLDNLALLSAEQGKQGEAEALYQRALQIGERSLGREHPQVATSLNSLANLFREQGKYAEAETLYRRALSLREQQLGQHHPETAQTLYDLAACYQKQSNPSEAIALAERALSIRSQSLGDAHPETLATQAIYDQLLQEQACAEVEAVAERSAEGGVIKDPSGRLTQQQMRRVLDFVQEHLAQKLSLEVLARQAGFSPSHFARLFRHTTGESPHQFVLHQRIKRAQRLLTEREVPLARVARACGFADQSHLTQAFKRHLGLTPRAYRQMYSQ